MAYRDDKDLAFLAELSSESLNDLVYVLTHDKDGKTRYTEELTNSELYKKYNPNHKIYWKEIAAEIQCFGANSIATLLRFGKGVEYREILDDVCKQMLKEKAPSSFTTAKAEEYLLETLLEKAINGMDKEQLEEFAKVANLDSSKKVSKDILIAAVQTIFKLGGFRSYQLTLIIVNSIYRALFTKGLTVAANAGIARVVGVLSGPIGWAITGALTAIDIAGPAYRVTIPAVIQVALLRKQHSLHLAQEEILKAIDDELDIDSL